MARVGSMARVVRRANDCAAGGGLSRRLCFFALPPPKENAGQDESRFWFDYPLPGSKEIGQSTPFRTVTENQRLLIQYMASLGRI
jgi:hypothetical protein